jgi:hypothetical protein
VGRNDYERMVRLYIVQDVPEDTKFTAKRPGEIAAHEWFVFDHLFKIQNIPSETSYNPRSFTGVFPFLEQIQKWLDEEK